MFSILLNPTWQRSQGFVRSSPQMGSTRPKHGDYKIESESVKYARLPKRSNQRMFTGSLPLDIRTEIDSTGWRLKWWRIMTRQTSWMQTRTKQTWKITTKHLHEGNRRRAKNWQNCYQSFDTHIYMNSAWRAINNASQAGRLKQTKIDMNQSPWFSGRNTV